MSARSSPSGELTRPAISPRTALAAVIAATLVVRLIVGAVTPLTEDEAYYKLWSLSPAFGYLDHPPMIAWWIWLGRHIAGEGALGVRLIPILATAGVTLLTFDLARLLDLGERVAARAAIWLNATFLIGVGGLLAVPDEPATLFWMLTLCCALRARRGLGAWWLGAWWLGAGLAAGLACLSKYSALFLAPGIVLWLATTTDGRRMLRTPWPWLAAVVAGAVFAPNVIWNADHNWLTFGKQFGRARVDGLTLRWLPEFVGVQYLLFNPLTAPFIWSAVRRRMVWPLLAVAAPFVIYLTWHSLHAEVQGQWPTPLYPGLVIAAAAAAQTIAPGRWRGWLLWLRGAAPVAGFAVNAAVLAFISAPLDGRLPVRDPAWQLRGWPGFFQTVEQERLSAGAAWLGTNGYGLAAQLGTAQAIHAPATEVLERERFSFEVPAERADFTKPGLIVLDTGLRPGHAPVGTTPPSFIGARVAGCFASVTPLPEIVRGEGTSGRIYGAFLVAGPRRDIELLGC